MRECGLQINMPGVRVIVNMGATYQVLLLSSPEQFE